MLWIAATLFASGFQVARNGLQRSMMASAGLWGATLVRFLFGLPFSVALALGAYVFTTAPHLRLSAPAFWGMAGLGAASQLLATATLLAAMRLTGFAIATALQQSSIPLAAVIGLAVFHDRLSSSAWIGVGVTTLGLLVLTWPRQTLGQVGEHQPGERQPVVGAMIGLISGLAFGVSLNAFRQAGHGLEPAHPVFAAMATVAAVQAMQTLALGSVLLIRQPRVLLAVIRAWRGSLAAGLCGSLASTGWFVALALAPAASVRAVGVVEAPMAAFAGHRLFGERLGLLQWLAGGATAVGVILTARG